MKGGQGLNNNPNNQRKDPDYFTDPRWPDPNGAQKRPNNSNRQTQAQPRQNQPRTNRTQPNNQTPRNTQPRRQTQSAQTQRPPQRQNYPPQQRQSYQDTYDQLPPVKHRSRQAARKAAGLIVLTVIVLVMLLVSVMIFITRCVSGEISEKPETDPHVTTPEVITTEPPDTDPVTTAPETTSLDENYTYKTMTLDDLHSGYQILVNYQNAFVFDSSKFVIKPFYGNKNLSYKVRDTLVSFDKTALSWFNEMMAAFEADTDRHDILVNSSYRTYDEQDQIYQIKVDQYSEEYASMFVAMPGFSEHHTGLAVDLTIYTDEKESKTFEDNTDYIDWMSENAHRFGFILRYPSEKTDITKIGYENWHYRYVGKPHAYYMKVNNLCLEEYIEALRSFTFDGKHLNMTDDEGQKWEIYFVPATSETTEVPVPKNYEYEVSGNNVDGFIVTIKK